MKTKMPKNWKPSDRFYELTDSKGIPREWISHQLPEIKLYWIERGVARCWDLTVLNWIKRAWEQVDKSRYYRQEVIKPFEQDLRQPEPVVYVQDYTTNNTKPLTIEARTAIADKYMKQINR